MDKLKKIIYIILIVIVAVLSLTIYTNASKDDGESQKEKTFSEIKFLETKLINLMNTMNNIEMKNYNVVTTELSKASTQNSDNNSSSSQSGSGGSSGGSSSGQTSSSEAAEEGAGDDKQDNKKFELRANGVLTNTENINWDNAKTEVENLYTSLPSITIDLYQTNVNPEDVLGFNTEYDNLTKVIKDENKEETLSELSKLYEYLPKFLKGSEQENLYTTLVETKNNIIKAYSKLDSENWQEISNDITNSINTYSKLLTDTNIPTEKQYSINKIYIMLNELQNAVNMQDTTVFLIKYKNLLEEINNI